MRSASHFSPEWGYLAPAPNFRSTVRIVVVAAAVGASAGAAAVFSLVDRPAGEESVAARTLAWPITAAAAPAGTPVVEQNRAMVAASAQAGISAAAESSTAATTQRPASAAALAESPRMSEPTPAPANDETISAPEATPPQAKAAKKQVRLFGWWRDTPRDVKSSRAPLALVPSNSTRTGAD